jgi:hypothetical protein
MAKKITSITQIDGGTNPRPKVGPYHTQPVYTLGSKPTHGIKPSMSSKNPLSKYVQGVIKATRPTKTMTPVQQITKRS